MTTDVYNNNQQKTVPAPLWRLQCPSGYLCPSRVDDEQGEKKQEMKRQGDKKNSKNGVWGVKERKEVLMASFG